MPTALIDDGESAGALPKGSIGGSERQWQALVFLAILVLTGVAGMGALFYRLEHPVPAEMFEQH